MLIIKRLKLITNVDEDHEKALANVISRSTVISILCSLPLQFFVLFVAFEEKSFVCSPVLASNPYSPET